MRYPGWVILFVVAACGPAVEDVAEPADAQRYARAVCDLAARCGCSPELLTDCEERIVRQFERVNDAEGTEFDRGCFEQLAEVVEADGSSCEGMELAVDCLVFEPRLPNQDSCDLEPDHPDVFPFTPTDCGKPGDWCVDGVCRSGLNELLEGEGCGVDVANSCGANLYCGLDLTCEVTKSVGQSCEAPRACGAAGYCRGVSEPGDTGICTPFIGEGLACEPGEIESCGVGFVNCGLTGTCEPRVLACSLATAYDDFYSRWVWERGASE